MVTHLQPGADLAPGLGSLQPPRPEKTMEPPWAPLFLRRNNEEEGEEEEKEGEEEEISPFFNYF